MNLREKTLCEALDALPPWAVRVLAKTGERLLTDRELMKRTGWSRDRLRRLYNAKSWSNARVDDIDTFFQACGLNWATARRQRSLLKEHIVRFGDISNMRHLKVKKHWKWSQARVAGFTRWVNACKARVTELLRS